MKRFAIAYARSSHKFSPTSNGMNGVLLTQQQRVKDGPGVQHSPGHFNISLDRRAALRLRSAHVPQTPLWDRLAVPTQVLRTQAFLEGVDNANARGVRGLRGWTGVCVHSLKIAQTAVVTAFARFVHAVHVPTDTTVISYILIQTRRRRGGAVDE